jgi:hypothetical protein
MSLARGGLTIASDMMGGKTCGRIGELGWIFEGYGDDDPTMEDGAGDDGRILMLTDELS